ncbi:MAG: hypothetical protein AABX16_05495 [Nanoarchaeota archaeon]
MKYKTEWTVGLGSLIISTIVGIYVYKRNDIIQIEPIPGIPRHQQKEIFKTKIIKKLDDL